MGDVLIFKAPEKVRTLEYFGGCPHCGGNDGYRNKGSEHFFFCTTHKVRWSGGCNLFSGWRDESASEQLRAWREAGLDGTDLVEAIYPASCRDGAL